MTISSSFAQGSSLLVTVSESGCGIPENQLPHIFEPFYTTKEFGTGLGLSIVKGIIDAHGGKIWAESEVGVGTQFHLLLPLVAPHHHTPPTPVIPESFNRESN